MNALSVAVTLLMLVIVLWGAYLSFVGTDRREGERRGRIRGGRRLTDIRAVQSAAADVKKPVELHEVKRRAA